MKLAEDIWLSSVTARNNLLAATNYTAAFYGNAALQSWSFGLTAPQVFWSAMARAVDKAATGADNLDAAPAVEAPKLSVVPAEAVPAPAEPAPVAEMPAADPETGPEASPLLLDAPRGGVADDLKLVKGIGAKMEASLNEFGIYHFDQIAGLDAEGIDWLDQHLPGFKRNCARFDLVSGAKGLLSA
jgi:predicted flap endonuclease-1-like 5' DNA nuclease